MTGNLLISLVAGVSITIVLLAMGVPYAVALGLLVAILDLIPLAGATVAGIIVVDRRVPPLGPGRDRRARLRRSSTSSSRTTSSSRVIYGRTVQLSPLVVLISVLVGAELAGILGALAAIPVAGALQVIIRDQLRPPAPAARRARHPACRRRVPDRGGLAVLRTIGAACRKMPPSMVASLPMADDRTHVGSRPRTARGSARAARRGARPAPAAHARGRPRCAPRVGRPRRSSTTIRVAARPRPAKVSAGLSAAADAALARDARRRLLRARVRSTARRSGSASRATTPQGLRLLVGRREPALVARRRRLRPGAHSSGWLARAPREHPDRRAGARSASQPFTPRTRPALAGTPVTIITTDFGVRR